MDEEPKERDVLIDEIKNIKVDTPQSIQAQQQKPTEKFVSKYQKLLFFVFFIIAVALIGCFVYLLWF